MYPIEEAKERGNEDSSRKDREDQLLLKLSQGAYNTKEVAEYLNISIPAAHDKLKSLVSRDLIVKKKVEGIFHFYVDDSDNTI